MQIVYKKSRLLTNIWPITVGSKVPSTVGRPLQVMASMRTTCDTRMLIYYVSLEILVITHAAAKILKNATYFLFMIYSPGATAP